MPKKLSSYKTKENFSTQFEVTSEMMNDFYAFAEAKGLKRDAVKEKKYEAKLKLNLKAFIAKQLWKMDGYYYIANTDDKVLKVALDKLAN